MSKILIFAEQRGGILHPAASQLVTAARELDGSAEIDVCVVGHDIAAAAGELAKLGVQRVLTLDDAKLDLYRPQPYTAALASAIANSQPQVVLLAATSMGRDLAPRVAVRTAAALATDCTALRRDGDSLVVQRPAYTGKLSLEVRLAPERLKIVSVRPNTFASAEAGGSAAAESLAFKVEAGGEALVNRELVSTSSGIKDVTEADVVVAGGRSLKSEDNFKLLFDLAETLDAAVGASRAACDAGYQPHGRQVGLTGKTVTPKLYLAFGIDGAIQHLAGMRGSKVIVAVNTKKEAPIFSVASYGCVADLFVMAPLLNEEFQKVLADSDNPMNWMLMTALLLGGWGVFAWTMWRRWALLRVGAAVNRADQPGARVALTLRYAFGQLRMYRYRWSGVAHIVVFSGFMVLLLRSLILWGRGYDEDFNLLFFGATQPLGMVYAVFKDTFALLVIAGTLIFFYYRVIKRLPRLTLSVEGTLILLIILAMMFSDILYDGARMARLDDFHGVEYAGVVAGKGLQGASDTTLRVLEHVGFWTHAALVLVFLNLLPYSKHFHVITAVPNVYTMNLAPAGRLQPVEDMEGKIEREETLGVAAIAELSWKSLLDLYTCTECGRCSDMCPATSTGKLLSPKQLTIDLRDHLYTRQDEVMRLGTAERLQPQPLVSEDLIKPEVLWACTTCRACEQECPVFISYVDKIVDLRRNLVLERSEFPDELQNAFRGLETSGNPWSYPADDRLQWTTGLDIPQMSETPDAEILLWVGCAPAFDSLARRSTVATARLLQAAGVKFAILGLEETCTGDAARRAGNEFLFQMMAEQNCETLNNYGVKRILTTCPHCFNTLKNEYPDFGGRYEVLHHTDYLLQLVRQGRLVLRGEVKATVAYHDSCYLGRYNDIYDFCLAILSRIPGVTLVEPEQTRDRGMCCGAGGAQMFKEEEAGHVRVNTERTQQLLNVLNNAPANGNGMVSTACPFCMSMLSDGLVDAEREDVEQLDVAEVLCRSVLGDSAKRAPAAAGESTPGGAPEDRAG